MSATYSYSEHRPVPRNATPVTTEIVERIGSEAKRSQSPCVPRTEKFVGTLPIRLAPFDGGQPGTATAPLLTREVRPAIREWSRELEKAFDDLARQDIYGELSPQEQMNFEGLQILRRKLHHPRKPEEILFEMHREKLFDGLVKQLAYCVRFINAGPTLYQSAAANPPWTSAKEKNSPA